MYDVAVIGSGYGGAAVAARLAAVGRTIIIERGRRWNAGDFPRGIAALARSYMSRRNPTGLWAMRLGEGTGAAFASAYGGSSVVNYGISIAPDASAFDDWPLDASQLEPAFRRAQAVLRPTPNPLADELGDKQFLDMLEPGRRRDIDNTIDWDDCTQCGRCVPGCNVGAKRSLDKSYLSLAVAAGAEAKLETVVRGVAPASGGGWWLELERTDGSGAAERIAARHVVIAAGTLGTLDILHRSRAQLPVGPCFGRHISLNGDGLAFLYDTRHRLSSHSGAPISTYVRLPFSDPQGNTRSLMVMSGRVPLAAMRFTGAALALAGELLRDRSVPRVQGAQWSRRLRDIAGVGADGALSRSFMYKLDGQDSSTGVARFSDRGAVVDWPNYGDEPVMRFAAERLEQWARRAGGTLIPNISQLPGMRAFSVHPLGGCRMGADVSDGVVDRVGRIFRPDGGVYRGLHVADGSILRGSLGVPPSLTIAALGEHVAQNVVGELSRAA